MRMTVEMSCSLLPLSLWSRHLSALLCCAAFTFFILSQLPRVSALQDERGESPSSLHGREVKKSGRDIFLGPPQPIQGDPLLKDFVQWLVENGAEGLSVQDKVMGLVALPLEETNGTEAQEGRVVEYGVVAEQNFRYPTTLVSLPRALWITSRDLTLDVEVEEGEDRGRRPVIPPAVPGAESDWDLALAVYLLNERAKGNESFWSPYLKMLPACDHIPFMFSVSELLQLQYRPFLQAMKSTRHNLNENYALAKGAGVLPEGFDSYKDFQWAFAIVWSRTFNVVSENYDEDQEREGAPPEEDLEDEPMSTWEDEMVDGDPREFLASETVSLGQRKASPEWKRHLSKAKDGAFLSDGTASMMLPYMDMLNHHFANTAVWEMQGRHVVMTAVKACAKGRPVYTSYGMKGNDEYFMNYGFTPNPNPYDSARLFWTPESVMNWYFENYVDGGGVDPGSELMSRIWTGYNETAADKVVTRTLDAIEATDEVWSELKAEGGEFRDNVGQELGEDEGTMFDLGPEYEYEDLHGYEVWPDAHVEPRLVAILTALRYSHVSAAANAAHTMASLSNEDLYDIVYSSIAMGRRMPRMAKCSEQRNKFVPFFTFTAQAIRERALAILASYATTLAEDVRLLQCAGVEVDYDKNDILPPKQSCPWNEQTLSNRMKSIVTFRLMKKQLLQKAASRLDNDCPISYLARQS